MRLGICDQEKHKLFRIAPWKTYTGYQEWSHIEIILIHEAIFIGVNVVIS
uniref:Uncharacterized protein n=1 Tax=Coccidioides posadasii RMSCC 3488 TaxID=454284 RepID=A0A0J6I4W2_COCPO|nr:hypothetical protein CPAG_02766 [Coccidioides posadasii RMSCC 3488]